VSQTCHNFSTNGKQLTTPKDRAKKIQSDYPRPMNKTRKNSFPASTCTSIQPGFTYQVDHGPFNPEYMVPVPDPVSYMWRHPPEYSHFEFRIPNQKKTLSPRKGKEGFFSGEAPMLCIRFVIIVSP